MYTVTTVVGTPPKTGGEQLQPQMVGVSHQFQWHIIKLKAHRYELIRLRSVDNALIQTIDPRNSSWNV